MSDYQEVRTTQHEAGRGQRVATFKATQLIWLLVALLEIGIALRVLFRLIGVNAANPFATLLYNLTNLFVAPFASLVPPLSASNMVFEISSIIAMIVYLLIGWALAQIVYVLFYRPRGPVSTKQTIINDHTPQQAPLGVSRTMTTDRTTTQAPFSASQTVVTERTNTQTPGPL
ncbi:MAG: YggT family protein [Anaerolineaceae bacterium]|nr:YggT family protein [Anaerolineaceae bacterium]